MITNAQMKAAQWAYDMRSEPEDDRESCKACGHVTYSADMAHGYCPDCADVCSKCREPFGDEELTNGMCEGCAIKASEEAETRAEMWQELADLANQGVAA